MLCLPLLDLRSIPDNPLQIVNLLNVFFKKQFLKLKDLLVKILEYTIDLDFRALLIVLI